VNPVNLDIFIWLFLHETIIQKWQGMRRGALQYFSPVVPNSVIYSRSEGVELYISAFLSESKTWPGLVWQYKMASESSRLFAHPLENLDIDRLFEERLGEFGR
jgi:hypothetical protein